MSTPASGGESGLQRQGDPRGVALLAATSHAFPFWDELLQNAETAG